MLDLEKQVVGYALLIAYWSNEFGGEVCSVDELFVAPDFRGRGHGAALLDAPVVADPAAPGGEAGQQRVAGKH